MLRLRRAANAERTLAASLGRKATVAELADATELSVDEITELRSLVQGTRACRSGEARSFSQVGRMAGRSAERARQVEGRALRELAANPQLVALPAIA